MAIGAWYFWALLGLLASGLNVRRIATAAAASSVGACMGEQVAWKPF
jgi:hypothetical protein